MQISNIYLANNYFAKVEISTFVRMFIVNVVAYSTAYLDIVAVLYAAAMLSTCYNQLIIFIVVFL